jgi:hypothetical protein
MPTCTPFPALLAQHLLLQAAPCALLQAARQTQPWPAATRLLCPVGSEDDNRFGDGEDDRMLRVRLVIGRCTVHDYAAEFHCHQEPYAASNNHESPWVHQQLLEGKVSPWLSNLSKCHGLSFHKTKKVCNNTCHGLMSHKTMKPCSRT